MLKDLLLNSGKRRNILWVIASFVAPYLVFILSAYILSLFWPSTRDMPELGLFMPLDLLPFSLGVAALVYCFSEIEFSHWHTKLLSLSVIIFGFFAFGLIVALMTSCAVYGDCL